MNIHSIYNQQLLSKNKTVLFVKTFFFLLAWEGIFLLHHDEKKWEKKSPKLQIGCQLVTGVAHVLFACEHASSHLLAFEGQNATLGIQVSVNAASNHQGLLSFLCGYIFIVPQIIKNFTLFYLRFRSF